MTITTTIITITTTTTIEAVGQGLVGRLGRHGLPLTLLAGSADDFRTRTWLILYPSHPWLKRFGSRDWATLSTTSAIVYPPRNPASEKSAAPLAARASETPPEKSGDGQAKKDVSAPAAGPLRSVPPWRVDAPPIVSQVSVATEHYNRLVRMTARGEKLRASVELQTEYHTADLMSANVIAEIPSTDLASELVMLGAQLDSWHSGTGTTDNAAGCAVVLEVARILRVLDLKPRRTVRVALWTGEEQNLLGSAAYVSAHFGLPKSSEAGVPPSSSAEDSVKNSERDKLSVYFNLDNGGGKIRGIHLQNNEAVRPIFRQWLKPFKDLGAETIALANNFGSDPISFDAAGLPGFAFIQDEIEYWSRTHHSNMDVYDRVIADDLKQAAVIVASFVYEAAMRNEKLPRKPGRSAAPAAATPPPPAGGN